VNRQRRQGGFTLVVALIMLLMMILMAVTTFKLGRSSLQLVDNQQQKVQAQNAAQETLDDVISGILFTTNPTAVLAGAGCGTLVVPSNSICVDANGDGRTIEVVTLATPSCIQARVLTNRELQGYSNLADQGCAKPGDPTTSGITPSTTGTDSSLCAATVWDLNATATESVSNTSAVIDEGVSLRVPTDTLATSCS
jgi:type II secretory pathway pseudopilin PulG